MAGRAAARPLWHDELFTLYISRMPDLGSIWDALAAGVDLNPPFAYLATRAALVFGDGLVAVRLPSIVGTGIAAVAVFAIAARPYGFPAGWMAAIVFLSTQAAFYGYEARPYALVVALTAVAVAAWQRAGVHRGWIVVLALALAAAVSTHYFAVLIFLPLAFGEMVRSRERRTLDMSLWVALAAGAAPLLAWLPLVRAAREFSGEFWARPDLDQMLAAYVWLVGNAALPLYAFIAAAAVTLAILRQEGRPAEPLEPNAGASPAEWSVMITLAALPTFALALGILVTGSFVARYALPAVIGWCVLLSWLACEGARSGRSRRAMAAGILAAGLWSVATYALAARQLGAEPPPVLPPSSALLSLPATPHRVVVTDVRVYLQLAEYGPASLRDRLVYPGKPPRAAAISRGNTGSEALQRLRQFVPLSSEPFDTLIGRREPLFVYGPPTWVGTLLLESGASLRLVGQDGGDRSLLHASWPSSNET